MTPARLAKRIGLTTGPTSTLLRRLEAAGHIVRSHDHADRRMVSVRSRSAVHEAAKQSYAPVAAALENALESFTTTELDVALRVLSALHDAFPAVTPTAAAET